MARLLIAVSIVALATVVAGLVGRRRRADPPTQPARSMPAQLDRRDFDQPGAEWLVVVFSSDSCSTCAEVVSKAQVLRSDRVAVDVVPFQARRALHERYSIDAVPCLVIADSVGQVHAGFLGPMSATDLWAAVAEARHPGTIDRSSGCGRHD